jgi:hypothetical protein
MYKSINIENELTDHYKKPTISTAYNLIYVGLKCCVSVFVTLSFIMICSRTYTKTNLSNTLFASTTSTTILNDFSDISNTPSDYFISIKVEDPTYGEIQTLDDLPWDALAEPYKKQYFSVDEFTIADKSIDLSSYIVSWTIVDQYNFIGNDQFVMLNNTGVYDATVTISSKLPTNSIYTFDFTLAVKYVRREIRSLTDEDRETFFSALEILYSLSETEGQRLYGSKFHTAEYFSYKHLTGAGTTDCDHWHDGAGIITHHMAFTLEFEQSLQSINPALTNPYWEYGMDSYLYDHWADSPIFDEDWFGMSSPTNPEHKIDDGGRWDNLLVPDGDDYTEWSIKDTGSLNPYINGFGHMRSPWNNNPFQQLGRHNKTYSMTQYETMPDCSILQSCFKSDSLADLNDCSNGETHGPVHILIGGAWGDGGLFNDEDVSMVQKPDKLLFFKVLWRMGYTRCPDTCTYGTPCKCAVPQQYIDDYGAETILKATNVYYALENQLKNADDELFLKVLRAVEDPGIAGEMFSSAAAFDPTFWPLHGQLERLLGAKRIMISHGTITNFDETWAFTEYNKASGAAYLNGICDWSNVAGSGDLTLPTCTLDVICDGHNEDDVLEFSNFLDLDDEYTNADFYEFIHPWSEDLPYTYDTWDFDYCADAGFSFTATSSATNPGAPNNNQLPNDKNTDNLPGIPGKQ